MIYIDLNRGYKTLIDDEDADLACLNWRTTGVKWNLYAYRETQMVRGVRGKCVSLHRLIAERMGLPVGDKSLMVDHINGNPLDNRRANLRMLSAQNNSRNQKDRADNTSGFKGVHFDRSRGKWMAHITEAGKMRNLGRFDSMEEAKAARLVAEAGWDVRPRRGAA